MTILTKDRLNADLDIAAENRDGIEYPLNHILNAAGTKIDPATEATLAAVNAKLPTLSGGSVPVTGPLTDTQLRATALPVSGTFWQATQPVSFTWAGLTDAQLRASAVPVSGPLTDTQLRAAAVPVSVDLELVEAIEAMRMAVQAMTRTMGQMQPDTAARMRVAVDSISAGLTLATLTTVTTVATLTNQTQIGGLSATEQIPSLMRLGADSMRRNISVT